MCPVASLFLSKPGSGVAVGAGHTVLSGSLVRKARFSTTFFNKSKAYDKK